MNEAIIWQAKSVNPTRAIEIPQSCPEIDSVIALVSDLYDEVLNKEYKSADEIQHQINEIMENIRKINGDLREALHNTDNALSLKDLAIDELEDTIQELQQENISWQGI